MSDRSAIISKSTGGSILIAAVVLVLFLSPISRATDTTAVQPKSAGTAYALAIGSLILPFVGPIAGPGFGHLYAGNTKQFWIGTGLRTVGWGGFVVAIALTWDNPDSQIGAVGGFSALGLALVSTIYDIATTGRSVRQYNQKHGFAGLSITPVLVMENDAPRIAFVWRF